MNRLILIAAATVASGWGCEGQPTSAAGPQPPPPDETLVVRDGLGLLFTFFDHTGQMRTVDRLRAVESEARRAVLVTDPRRSLGDDRVYVADLTVHDPRDDTYPTWVEQKGTWLDRVMPRVSVATIGRRGADATATAAVGRATRRSTRRRGAGGDRTSARAAAAAATAPEAAGGGPAVATAGGPPNAATLPKVIVFGTGWCPSCRLARDYLRQRGVRFLDIDVEQQPEAGKKMVEIQQANGMRPGAVPLIIVNGRVFQGFSRFQLEVAINNLQQAKAS